MEFFLIAVLFTAAGTCLVCFADTICNWQIRLLQLRGYRVFVRVIGGVYVGLGLAAAASMILER